MTQAKWNGEAAVHLDLLHRMPTEERERANEVRHQLSDKEFPGYLFEWQPSIWRLFLVEKTLVAGTRPVYVVADNVMTIQQATNFVNAFRLGWRAARLLPQPEKLRA